MYRRLLSIPFLMMAFLSVVNAIPVKRGQWRTIRLADGTSVKVELRGDEWAHYWQGEDGRVFVADTMVADRYRETTIAAINKRTEARRSVAVERRSQRLRRMAKVPSARAPFGQGGDIIGTKKGLVILVGFDDLAFEEGHTKRLYERILNEENYDVPPFTGSVHDYFNDQSLGKFDLTFDVVGPVTVSKSYGYYGKNDASGNDLHPTEMVREALDLISDSVNFADYDWDGDGEADQVFVLYAGHGEADYSDVDPATIWPHEWQLIADGSPAPTYDGITVDTYACSNETAFDGTISGIGTICHEFSHCLGFPDEYDMNGDNFGMSRWSLMDYGSYNGGNDNGYQPSGFTSYEKMTAGWLTPVVLDSDTVEVQAMQPLEEADEAYIIYNKADPDEYYLLENRQQIGWDASQCGSGLLILHIDYDADIWQNNRVNTEGYYYSSWGTLKMNDHQRCTIFHADNKTGSWNSDLAGDPYPYNSNDELTSTSRPAATFYNANEDGSSKMEGSVCHITQNSDGTVSFTYLPPVVSESSDSIEGVDFYESFNQCEGIGGNDGLFMGINSSTTPVTDNSGWTYYQNKAYSADQCLRVGSSSVQGQATTPAFTLSSDQSVLSFRAAAWGSESGSELSVSVICASDTLTQTFDLSAGAWEDYTMDITGQTGQKVQLLFKTSKKRFFLDEVKVAASVASGIADHRIVPVTDRARTAIYTLSGVYVGTSFESLPHGIYIRNGKKIVK